MAAVLFSSKDSDKGTDDGSASAGGGVDQLSIGSRTPLNSMPRCPHSNPANGGKDELLTLLLRHHTGDLRQVTTQHLGSSVGDIKAQYLEAVSRLQPKDQQFLASDFTAAHLRTTGTGDAGGGGLFASAAKRMGAGQLSAVQNPSSAASASPISQTSPASGLGGASPVVTSTRFSGVLGKNFNFKNITPTDLTFATRDGHILRDAEKVAPLRRPDTGIVEIFVVPPVPHRAQEPLVVVSALFPFPNANQLESHVVIRDYDFASYIANAEQQQQQTQNLSGKNSPGETAAAGDQQQKESSAAGEENSTGSSSSPTHNTPVRAPSPPLMMHRRAEPLLVREVQIPPPPVHHLPSPPAAAAAAASAAAAEATSAEPESKSRTNFSSGLPLPTARDLSRMSIASQQTAAASTCGDFIVHVHPEHATIIEGTSNPNAANSSSASSQPPIILSATSTQRKRSVPVSEFSCKISALYGRTDYWQQHASVPPHQPSGGGGNLPKTASDVSGIMSTSTSSLPAEVTATERAASYYSPAWWSPVHAYTSPDGNFIVVHLVPKGEARIHLGGGGGGSNSSAGLSNASFAGMTRSNSMLFDPMSKTGHATCASAAAAAASVNQNSSSNQQQQQQHIAGSFLIFESVSRGSSWICRGAVRLPHVDSVALSGWATENRFVVCVGATHCVIKVEHEGPIQVKCTTLHLSQQLPLPGASTADTAPHFDSMQGFGVSNGGGGGGGASTQRQHRRVTTLQLIRALPEYTDDTLLWFDSATQLLRIAHPPAAGGSNLVSPSSNNSSSSPNREQHQTSSSSLFNGMALHFKRRHANPLLFGYVLQSRQPKWQLQSSSLPQFVISPGESGFNGISLEEASHCSSGSSSSTAALMPPTSSSSSPPVKSVAAAAAAASNSNNNSSRQQRGGGVGNNSFALSSVSMATVNPITAGGNGVLTQQLAGHQQTSSSQPQQPPQQQDMKPQPQALYFLHQLHAAQTAPFPPDEAILLHFPQQLVYVSEHQGRTEDVFKTAVVSPAIQPGSIVAAHYFNMRDAGAASSSSSGGDNKDNKTSSDNKNSSNSSPVPSRLRLVYVSDNVEDRSTTIHIVTLQADWKAPAETGAGIIDFFKRKLSFFSSKASSSSSSGSGGSPSGGGSEDAATQAKAKEAERLAVQSHKSLNLSGMEAFQHGACDCYMASAAPVGVVVKATGSVGGVAVVRLRAV